MEKVLDFRRIKRQPFKDSFILLDNGSELQQMWSVKLKVSLESTILNLEIFKA